MIEAPVCWRTAAKFKESSIHRQGPIDTKNAPLQSLPGLHPALGQIVSIQSAAPAPRDLLHNLLLEKRKSPSWGFHRKNLDRRLREGLSL